MFAPKLESHSYQQPNPFIGVRFVLFGFNSTNEPQVRSKLVNGGGVYIGQYNQDCTHVIVDKLVYDDPVCIAARNDGKTLVTGLWVDHSFDIGMPVDHTSIMYRPLKDLNGILGAKNFIMCLTGYQRQDRDDIMTMVGLMGARFSKPLVANKVTHLICYKFEGEKYELAKKMKIKLVNHKWLEDCLSAWEILPEAKYNKSGYELEMETEAKDSEEEAEDSTTMQFRGKSMNVSPYNIQTGISRAREMPTSVHKVLMPLDTTVSIGPSNVVINEDIPSIAGNEAGSGRVSSLNIINEKHPEVAQLPDRYDRTPVSTKVVNNLASTSGSAKKSPHSGVRKLTGASFKRKTPKKSTHQGEISTNLNSSSTVQLDELKISVGIEISPSKADQVMDKDASVKTPTKGSGLVHADEFTVMLTQKRKTGANCASSKSQKIGHDSILSITRSPSANNKIQGLESTPLSHSPGLPVNTNGVSLDEAAFLNVEERSPSDIYRTKSSSSNRKSLTRNLPLSETRTSEIGQDNNAEKAPGTLSGRLKGSAFSCKPATLDFDMGRSVHEVGGTGEFQDLQQTVDALSPSKRTLEFDKSPSPAHVDLLRGENAASLPKPVKSMGRKKSLGSKSKLGLSNTANRKGSIYLDKTLSQNDTATCPDKVKETASHKQTSSANKLQVAPCFNGTEPVMEVKSNDVPKPRNDVENKIESTDDDDTEAPEEKDVHELEKAVHEKSELVEVSHKPDMMVEEILEGGQHIINDKASIDNAMALEEDMMVEEILEGGQHIINDKASIDNAMALEEDKNGSDHGEAVDGKRIEGESTSKMDAMALEEDKSGPDHGEAVDGNKIEDESTSKKDAVRRKATKGKKRPFGKSKMNTVCTVTANIESEKTVSGDETGTEKIIEKSEMEVVRGPQHSSKSHSNNVPADKLEDTIELEKENTPMIIGNKRMDGNEQRVEKVAVKSSKTQMKANQKSRKVDPASVQIGGLQKRVKDEPMWFILSGHRLQKKEFQKMIRNLRGRVCRDSHQWSYQATHFIVPDPIRRTEKFFAAAASGRWILNTDYLTASNQAGKFLAEEPYEWHKIGLSEDGAINLEAPKKWRLVREKTGHGAFYGMRIIIYGECIAPPLDTLKRAIKAGDGTILATSPPYTRFLTSGVDFAIVTPGMPRVDIWVQEFLRHEIPCVLADYLVEYVCKPGYSLEKHVQYNTHSWAEKSFANLLSRSEEIIEDLTPPLSKPEEIVEDLTTPVNHGMKDLTCQVCGSSDRGDIMLICGNETGSAGCGVGTHIDCCDPPLEVVPEEDWFCPNCSRSNTSSTPPRSTKKKKTSKRK